MLINVDKEEPFVPLPNYLVYMCVYMIIGISDKYDNKQYDT